MLYAVLATALARWFGQPDTLGALMERAYLFTARERAVLARGIGQVRTIAELVGRAKMQAGAQDIEFARRDNTPRNPRSRRRPFKKVVKATGLEAREGEAALLLKGVKHPGLVRIVDVARQQVGVWTFEAKDWIIRESVTLDLSEELKTLATNVVEGIEATRSPYRKMRKPGSAFVNDKIKEAATAPPGSYLHQYKKHAKALADVGNAWKAAFNAGVEITDIHPGQFGRIGKRVVMFDFGNATMQRMMKKGRGHLPRVPRLGKLPEDVTAWLAKHRLVGSPKTIGEGAHGVVLKFREMPTPGRGVPRRIRPDPKIVAAQKLNPVRAFKLRPRKAMSYFKALSPARRIPLSKEWLDDHRREAFTMAEVTEATILKRVHKLIYDAIEEGDVTTRDFQVKLKDLGVTSKNPQYAEMVFRTNALDSYNKGYYDEVREDPDLREYFPYWEYLAVEDDRLSEEHGENLRGENGPYYPASRSFDSIRGDRVFNCRCSFRWVDKFEAEELGLVV